MKLILYLLLLYLLVCYLIGFALLLIHVFAKKKPGYCRISFINVFVFFIFAPYYLGRYVYMDLIKEMWQMVKRIIFK